MFLLINYVSLVALIFIKKKVFTVAAVKQRRLGPSCIPIMYVTFIGSVKVSDSATVPKLKMLTKLILHQSTAASTWWCGPRPRLSWVEMVVGLPEGPSYPGHSPFIFSLCCPLNDRRRAAHSIFKIGRLFSLFLLSCPTLALLRLLILLLLMSGNVHPNPGPIFSCSVCAGNVTWLGKSVQCCTCSKWVHLRCSQLSLSNFRALGSSHSWSCPPCRNTVTPPSDSSDTYISTGIRPPLC